MNGYKAFYNDKELGTTRYHIRSPRGRDLAIFEDGTVPGSGKKLALDFIKQTLNARMIKITVIEEDITHCA